VEWTGSTLNAAGVGSGARAKAAPIAAAPMHAAARNRTVFCRMSLAPCGDEGKPRRHPRRAENPTVPDDNCCNDYREGAATRRAVAW
jgi:hypothetical protein